MKKLIAVFMLFCFSAHVHALPPAMEADGFLVEAQQHIKNQDYNAASEAMKNALELIEKHDLGLEGAGGVTFYYAYADVANKAGDYTVAFEMVNRYLEAAGRSGAHYQKALELYKAIQTTVAQAEARVKALIDEEGGVNAKDKYDWTPLHSAAGNDENPEVARLLIERGADVNAKDKHDWTPLHSAAEYNKNPEVARLLIERGADVNAKDNGGWTPLHNAVTHNKNPEVARLLIERGADVNAKSNGGYTPLNQVNLPFSKISSADKGKVRRWLKNPGLLRR